MGWFDILKVEDIDFDGSSKGFGHYGVSGREVSPMELMNAIMTGKAPKLEDMVNEEIRINHKNIYRYLRNKLDREPTEREIQEFVIRTIMHESTHAGMGFSQLPMTDAQKEYGAFTGQFPDNIFYRLKTYLSHPAIGTQVIHPEMASLFGIRGNVTSEVVEQTKKFVAFAEAITDNINVDAKTKDKIKDKLARLEVTARTQKKPFENLDPTDVDTWVERYGSEHKGFLEKLYAFSMHRNNNATFSDKELKMAGAVTTGSAPAMFNKVVRGRKKRRDKDARR